MPFPITCTACGKTFAIADDVYERKVKGRIVTIKCKQCQAGIRIDDSRGGAAAVHGERLGGAQPEPAPIPVPAAIPPLAAAAPKEEPKPSPKAESKPEVMPPTQGLAAPIDDAPQAQPAAAPQAQPSAAPKAQPTPTASAAAKAPGAAAPGGGAPKAQSAPVAPRSPTLLGITAPKAHHLAAAAAGKAAEPAAAAPRAQPTSASAPRAQPSATARAQPTTSPGVTPKAPASATPRAGAATPKVEPAKPESKPLAAARPEPEPTPATEILWAVDYPDGQDRELTAEQIGKELASGAINETSLVWREGMAEWQELSQVPELLGPKLTSAPAAVAQRAKAPSAPQLEPAMHRPRAASSPAPAEPAAPKPRAPSAPFIPAPAAQRPKMASAPALPPPAPIPKASVPFSPFDTPFDAPKPSPTFPAASLPISDLTPLTFPASPAPAAIAPGPAGVATVRAAPLFVARPPVPIAAVPQGGAVDEWPRPKSRAPLIIGVLIAIVAIGAGTYFLTSSREAPPPPAPISALPAAAPTTAHTAEPTATADPASTPGTSAPSEGATPRGALDQPGAAPMTTPNAGFAELFANGARRADEKQGPAGATQRFDANAAKAALATAAASTPACREKGGPAGKATIVVTFEPSGKVSSATVSDAPFAGTSSGTCIAATMKRATIPAFSGLPGTVTKIISIQ